MAKLVSDVTQPGLPEPASERGFALVIVTIILAALSLIVASALSTMQTRIAAVADGVERLKRDAALDGAFATAAAGLSGAPNDTQIRLGRSFALAFDGTETETTVTPASAKLDLNAADPARLVALFRASGIEARRASRLKDEVVAWRSEPAGQASRVNDAAAPHRFLSADEIALLPDGGTDVADCLKPDLTIFAGVPTADANFASSRLRASLATSTTTGQGIVSAGGPAASGGAPLAVSAGEVFDIVTRARSLDTGEQETRETVVRVTGDPNRPIWILAQARPDPDGAVAKDACNRLSVERAAAGAGP